jgi:hypothetical protein
MDTNNMKSVQLQDVINQGEYVTLYGSESRTNGMQAW